MSELPVSPLFRPEDQPKAVDLEEAERIARESGTGFIPEVHQWPSSLRVNQAGSRRMVELRCPTCHVRLGCFEDELPHSLDTHTPSCGGQQGQLHPPTPFVVTRYGSGPIDLRL